MTEFEAGIHVHKYMLIDICAHIHFYAYLHTYMNIHSPDIIVVSFYI